MMADYEVIPEAQAAKGFINNGPNMAKLLRNDIVHVEPASESAFTSWTAALLSTNSLVALCSCIVMFTVVLAIFVRYREHIRRFVTGENRRVGSVYYVRPGIAATQPTEI